MPALATQSNWPSIVQKDLSIVFADQYRQKESMLGAVVQFKDATQGTEYDLEGGDIGEVGNFNDTGIIGFSSPTEGYKKSVSEVQWALGIKATRQLLRNDLYGVLKNRAAALADAFADKREAVGASPFVDGFTSFTTGDTLSLFNTAHTNNQNALTQSNRGTTAFSPTAVETARLAMLAFKTNADQKMAVRMDTLIVPANLEEKAYELIKSAGKVDTANNNRNFHQGKYKLIVWENYLADANNWFAADMTLMKRHLIFREWEPVQFFRSGEFDTLVAKFAGYMSINISSVEWRWGYGNIVS